MYSSGEEMKINLCLIIFNNIFDIDFNITEKNIGIEFQLKTIHEHYQSLLIWHIFKV